MTSSQCSPWRYFTTIAIIAIAYFGIGKWTLASLGLGFEAAPIWPPAGIALAALILQGRWAWPGVALGEIFLAQSLGVSGLMTLGSVVGMTLQALAAATLLQWIGFRPSFGRLRDALGLVAIAVLATPLINATIGTFAAYLAGEVSRSDLIRTGWTFWLGDGMGVLFVTPMLLVILRAQFPLSWKPWRILEWLLCLSLLVSVSLTVFICGRDTAIAQYPLEYLPFPILVWAALRFGQLGALLGSLVVSSIALQGAMAGYGPFLAKATDSDQAILFLQAFMGVTTITVFVLAAASGQLRLAAERNRLIKEMALQIRQSLDPEEILNTTVSAVRQSLQADRVFFSCFDESGQCRIVAESVVPPWPPTHGTCTDTTSYGQIQSLFQNSRLYVVSDTARSQRPPWLQECDASYHTRATIAVAIMLEGRLFGVLVANQCSRSRQWQALEVDLMDQLGTQVAIAIQQGQLYKQVQTLNTNLEEQVAERTAQLQQKMRELQQVNRLKDVFLHALSHDLRTTVMGNLLVLKNLQTKPGNTLTISRNILERMIQGGEHQLSKLNSLLDAYTSYTQGLALQCERVSLHTIIQAVLDELEPCLQKNQVILTKQIPTELPCLEGDPTRLRCVFEHLLTNAIKHNPPGVHLIIGATATADSVYCTVQDDGVGICSTQCDRLFDLCIGDDHATPQLTGVSLGLYLCRQIITAHGGQIGVRSQPHTGSTFWFTLPLSTPVTANTPRLAAMIDA